MSPPRLACMIIAGTALLLGSQAMAQSAARVDMKRLLDADAEAGQWMSHSRTFDEQYFSPLKEINDNNVSNLGLAFFVDLPTNQNVETTPLMIDGVLYVTLPWSKVMAVDAKTGKQLWAHDPKVAGAWNINLCCGVDNRGAAAWNGKIIFGTLDGRLIALDAKTGKQVWSTKSTPDERRYSITGAPRIANGKVLHRLGRWRVRRAWIYRRLRRRNRQAAMAVLDRSGRSRERLREQRDENGRRDLEDARLVDQWWWRNGMGRHHLRPRSRTW